MNNGHSRRTRTMSMMVMMLVLLLLSTTSSAYDRWSVNDDATNCGACHGDFRSNAYISPTDGQIWGNIHNIHRQDMLNGDCNACHGNDTFPVLLASSSGGSGLDPIGCMGCHGRAEDNVAGNPEFPNGAGAGLRQHHFNAGVTECVGCHLDADPANYVAVGEDVLPPYYADPGTNHPDIPTDPCNQDGSENFAGAPQGQDNDGDGLYDADDGDCTETAVPGAAPPSVLVTNFPNPFNPQTTIRYAIETAGTVRLAIYSVDGVLVRVLREGHLEAGNHDQRWDGTDSRGRPMNSGLYLCRLETATASLSRPMMLVR